MEAAVVGVAVGAARTRAVCEGEASAAVRKCRVEGARAASEPDEDGADVPLRVVRGRAADALDAKLGSKPEIEMRVATTLGRSLVRVGRPERGLEVGARLHQRLGDGPVIVGGG